jgi:hypothetical protein
MSERTFWFEVGDEATLTVDEIWPDGDAPENPTVDDVIAHIKQSSSRHSFATDWGFVIYVSVDGKEVW